LQRNVQVFEYLRCLPCKIAFADNVAVAIKRSLAGDENNASAANLHHLRIAWRDAKLGRVNPFDCTR
jgi:hypothetical protein